MYGSSKKVTIMPANLSIKYIESNIYRYQTGNRLNETAIPNKNFNTPDTKINKIEQKVFN